MLPTADGCGFVGWAPEGGGRQASGGALWEAVVQGRELRRRAVEARRQHRLGVAHGAGGEEPSRRSPSGARRARTGVEATAMMENRVEPWDTVFQSTGADG
ncbi:hypothetical protein M6B38_328955 [Iris pallida]|uniref:Uncharacterized protein n=1 Tax=Iris pallida TaxID=29817 RepID=A0AAX6H5H3_IRIPA|nr:hypothetical protein M6B38_328955 [Iris pallida]